MLKNTKDFITDMFMIITNRFLPFKKYLFFIFGGLYSIYLLATSPYNDKTLFLTIKFILVFLLIYLVLNKDNVLRKERCKYKKDLFFKFCMFIYLISCGFLIPFLFYVENLKSSPFYIFVTILSIILFPSNLSYLMSKCNTLNKDFILFSVFLGYYIDLLIIPFQRSFISFAAIQLYYFLYIIFCNKFDNNYYDIPLGFAKVNLNLKNPICLKTYKNCIHLKSTITKYINEAANTVCNFFNSILNHNTKVFLFNFILIMINFIMFFRTNTMFYKKIVVPDSNTFLIYLESSSLMCFMLFIWIVQSMYWFYDFHTTSTNLSKLISIILILTILSQFVIAPLFMCSSFVCLLIFLFIFNLSNKPAYNK